MNKSQIVMSFRKEIWEFKKTLFWVPLIIAIFIIAAPLLQLILMEDYQSAKWLDIVTNAENLGNVEGFTRIFLTAIMGMFVPFIMVSLIIQLYYFTTCLFDERRDLSVYFWRSLPVSDVLSIGVKLMTGALIVPTIFMLAATCVVFVFLLFALIACTVLSLGYDISLWGLWGSADIIGNLTSIWLNLLPYALWMFPVFAWLMLASMFANKAPFLWAILPIAAILLIESFVVEYLHLGGGFFLNTLREYFAFGQGLFSNNVADTDSTRFILFSALSSKISIVATLIAIGFMYLTYWLRVNRSHA
ncbi:MAG: ABC-2 type transport system permease protein [Paraglaciecola sp.]|jgi:ABC-2 type transport system permease protein